MLKASIKKRTGSRSHENSRGSIEFKIRSLQQISDELGVDLPFLLTMIRRKQLRAKRDRRGHWKVTRSAYVEFISTCKYLPVWPLPPGYLSVEQACRESGFHRETIRYQIKHGYVESILYRNRFRAITRASWGAYLKFRRAGRKHMPPPPTGYLKPIAAAKMAGVTYPTIREWIRKKGLPALAISRCRVLIKETDLTAFLKRLPTLPLFNSLPAGTISATHAAKRAGTTPRTIVASIAAETLPAIKLPNGRYAVREAALAAFMKERTSVKEEQNPPGQVSLKQAARLAGVTPPSVKRWIQACGLPAMLSTGRYLIKTEDLQAFLKCRASTQRRSHVHLPTGCITAQEAAKRVGVTRSTLRKWIARG